MEDSSQSKLLDHTTLRLLVGLIAFCLPFAVSLGSSSRLNSISAAYYTEAKYVLLVMLILVGIFLFAYNGHSPSESLASKTASIAAIMLVIFPSDCADCRATVFGQIHFVAGAVLLLILAYFCLVPFQKDTRGATGKRARRSLIYRVCGWTMLACIAGLFFANVFLSGATINKYRLTYYGEAISLIAFGIAWIVSGRVSRLIADEDELFHLFGK